MVIPVPAGRQSKVFLSIRGDNGISISGGPERTLNCGDAFFSTPRSVSDCDVLTRMTCPVGATNRRAQRCEDPRWQILGLIRNNRSPLPAAQRSGPSGWDADRDRRAEVAPEGYREEGVQKFRGLPRLNQPKRPTTSIRHRVAPIFFSGNSASYSSQGAQFGYRKRYRKESPSIRLFLFFSQPIPITLPLSQSQTTATTAAAPPS